MVRGDNAQTKWVSQRFPKPDSCKRRCRQTLQPRLFENQGIRGLRFQAVLAVGKTFPPSVFQVVHDSGTAYSDQEYWEDRYRSTVTTLFDW